MLTFVVPVRHPENARDWSSIRRNLTETLRSIANQEGDEWKAIVVANRGSDLPALPAGSRVVWVDFPPNPLYMRGIWGSTDRDQIFEAFRFDKGRRVLAGLVESAPHGHIMILDDDDLVSRRLTQFVSSHPDANGWIILTGYFWNSGSSLLYEVSDFSWHCGSCHVVRSDLYRLPASVEDAETAYVRRTLGSHVSLYKDLEAGGSRLDPLPFAGAIYRIGHSESHMRSGSIIHRFLLRKGLSLASRLRALRRLKLKTPSMEREFFGRS